MTTYKIQGLRSLRDEMKAVARGERPAPADAARSSFNSVEAVVRLLTPENRALLAMIRDRQPQSVAELVQLSGRSQPNLTRTLAKLEAGPRHVPPWVRELRIPVVDAPPETPEIHAESCASPRHEALEALRWARELVASRRARPEEIAITATSPEEWASGTAIGHRKAVRRTAADAAKIVFPPQSGLVTETLGGELQTFVTDGEYGRGLIRILELFLAALGRGDQGAVWISGFYGSGKSHLAKMLGALWDRFRVPRRRACQRSGTRDVGGFEGGAPLVAGRRGSRRRAPLRRWGPRRWFRQPDTHDTAARPRLRRHAGRFPGCASRVLTRRRGYSRRYT